MTYLSLTQFDDVVIAGAVSDVEGITLDGWGGNDDLTGSSGVDSIWGGDGNDVIRGGIGFNPAIIPSTDRLRGEAGDDIIYIGSDGAEASGGIGNDIIYGGDARDTIVGDEGNDTLYGGGGNDGLTGGDGDDYIDGGTGADYMSGGDGSDTYVIDDAGDGIYETDGNNTVLSSISYVMPTAINVLTLTGNANINGTGNFLANVINGNAGANRIDGGAGADTLKGGGGDDIYVVDTVGDQVIENADEGMDTVQSSASHTLSANVENLTLTGGAAVNANGNDLANLVIGNGASNALDGGGGNDTLNGGAGNDILRGGGGEDTLDGGSGSDTATYAGLFRSYDVQLAGAAGTIGGGPEDDSDTLRSVENIVFQDGVFVFDADGIAAQVTRLYDTVLQRGPDQVGLDSWVDRLEDQGGTLKQIAAGFLNSAEFQALTGQLSNGDYVDFLYQNALGRSSDVDGKSYWVGQLQNGAQDRAELLIGFSESQEHRTITADLVGQGFFNTDDDYQAVALLYDTFAGRRPDAEGLVYWAEAIENGTLTLDQVADGFANSPEFLKLTQGMSNSQLVDFMYQNTLDRASDPTGLQYWTGRLDAGMDRGDLLLGFSQSYEHFNLLGPQVTSGIDYL